MPIKVNLLPEDLLWRAQITSRLSRMQARRNSSTIDWAVKKRMVPFETLKFGSPVHEVIGRLRFTITIGKLLYSHQNAAQHCDLLIENVHQMIARHGLISIFSEVAFSLEPRTRAGLYVVFDYVRMFASGDVREAVLNESLAAIKARSADEVGSRLDDVLKFGMRHGIYCLTRRNDGFTSPFIKQFYDAFGLSLPLPVIGIPHSPALDVRPASSPRPAAKPFNWTIIPFRPALPPAPGRPVPLALPSCRALVRTVPRELSESFFMILWSFIDYDCTREIKSARKRGSIKRENELVSFRKELDKFCMLLAAFVPEKSLFVLPWVPDFLLGEAVDMIDKAQSLGLFVLKKKKGGVRKA